MCRSQPNPNRRLASIRLSNLSCQQRYRGRFDSLWLSINKPDTVRLISQFSPYPIGGRERIRTFKNSVPSSAGGNLFAQSLDPNKPVVLCAHYQRNWFGKLYMWILYMFHHASMQNSIYSQLRPLRLHHITTDNVWLQSFQ